MIKYVNRLAIGSAQGQYSSLFTKAKAIDAKHGKFEILLCVGEFFAPKEDEEKELDDLLDGKLAGPFGFCFYTKVDLLF